MRKMKIILAIFLLLSAIAVCFWPIVHRHNFTKETAKVVEQFLGQPEAEEIPYAELYAAMQEYDDCLVGNQREYLTDPWSYEQTSFDLTDYGLESDVFGILEIPETDLSMPIYLGATNENMAKGAVHLSNTSLPIGGMSTNSVIAGHRGYSGSDYFRHLDLLAIGDEIHLTNLWETLHYQVAEIKIIAPTDIEQIYVQEGRELLTLLTCHPYASGGKQRLVIYCERIESEP